MTTNLTEECKAGYNAADTRNPYLFSSPSWMAWSAGDAVKGMSGVRSCNASRGYSVRILTTGGAKVTVRFLGADLMTRSVVREG